MKSSAMIAFHADNTTPRITKNGPQWVWVFESNLAGRHGAGAAKVARVNFGAEYGVTSGQTGKSYAIPTKDKSLNTLEVDAIKPYIDGFLAYASSHPKLRFFVTRIGCGLAGYKDEEIGPLFAQAPENCSIPEQWQAFIVSQAREPAAA
jgi:hypothetical protein